MLSASRTLFTFGKPRYSRAFGVWVWGDNRDGKLGLGHYSSVDFPTLIPGLETAHALDAACGRDHSLILLKIEDSAVRESLSRPQEPKSRGLFLSFLERLVQPPAAPLVESGPASDSLSDQTFVYSFGSNYYGQCGIESKVSLTGFSVYSDEEEVLRPTQVLFPVQKSPKKVYASGFASFAQFPDATLCAWGGGALGMGNTHFHTLPQVQRALNFYKKKRLDLVPGELTNLAKVTPLEDALDPSVPHELYVWGPWDAAKDPILTPALVTEALGREIVVFGPLSGSIGFFTVSTLPAAVNGSQFLSVYKPATPAVTKADYPYSCVLSDKDGGLVESLNAQVFLEKPTISFKLGSVGLIVKASGNERNLLLLDAKGSLYSIALETEALPVLLYDDVKDFTLSCSGSMAVLFKDQTLLCRLKDKPLFCKHNFRGTRLFSGESHFLAI